MPCGMWVCRIIIRLCQNDFDRRLAGLLQSWVLYPSTERDCTKTKTHRLASTWATLNVGKYARWAFFPTTYILLLTTVESPLLNTLFFFFCYISLISSRNGRQCSDQRDAVISGLFVEEISPVTSQLVSIWGKGSAETRLYIFRATSRPLTLIPREFVHCRQKCYF